MKDRPAGEVAAKATRPLTILRVSCMMGSRSMDIELDMMIALMWIVAVRKLVGRDVEWMG